MLVLIESLAIRRLAIMQINFLLIMIEEHTVGKTTKGENTFFSMFILIHLASKKEEHLILFVCISQKVSSFSYFPLK